MPDPMVKGPIWTVASARRESLKKWKRVSLLSARLFSEINDACGFCFLGVYLAEKSEGKIRSNKCDHCVVQTRCDAILSVTNNLEKTLEEIINGTIDFLEDMDVKKK